MLEILAHHNGHIHAANDNTGILVTITLFTAFTFLAVILSIGSKYLKELF